MLKDITLGQYFPTNSILHKLDARIKLVLTFALITGTFLARTPLSYALLLGFILLCALLSKVPLRMYIKSLKPMLFLLLFTALLNLYMTPGTPLPQLSWWVFNATQEGLVVAGLMFLRIIALIFVSSILTYTTSPIQLTAGMESLMKPLKWLRFPVHEMAMMMTIALRFIPILIDETDKIIKAQTARGVDFTSGGLIKRAKALVPILIPLFISAFRRADELALAMESRCYNGGEGRTCLNVPKLAWCDFGATAACVVIITGIILT